MQIVARDGLMVRPLTVLVVERLSERHDSPLDPGGTDVTKTATHCILASSVNKRVPFRTALSPNGLHCMSAVTNKMGREPRNVQVNLEEMEIQCTCNACASLYHTSIENNIAHLDVSSSY